MDALNIMKTHFSQMTISGKFLFVLLTLVSVGVVGVVWALSADKAAIASLARTPQAEGSQVELAPVDVTVVHEAMLGTPCQIRDYIV